MAQTLHDGFEDGDYTNDPAWTATGASSGSNWEVNSNNPYSGDFSLMHSGDGSFNDDFLEVSVPSASGKYSMQVIAPEKAWNTAPLLQMVDSDGTSISFRQDKDGFGASLNGCSSSESTSRWSESNYSLFVFDINKSGDDYLRVYNPDGTLKDEFNVGNCIQDPDKIIIGTHNENSQNAYYDDLKVPDSGVISRSLAEDLSLNSSSKASFNDVVTTNPPSNISADSATLEGTLESLEGESSVDVYFEYRETGASTWNQTTVQTLNSTGSFNENITGLNASTEYEYRAVAETSTDTFTAIREYFTTLSDKDQFVGRFQTPSSTGTQTITDLPFEPDVVQFITTNTNSSFDTDNNYGGGPFGYSHGFSDIPGNTHVALCSASGSNSTNGQNSESSNSYSVNMLVTSPDGANVNGRIQGYATSSSQGQFTMQWDTTYEQQYVIYRAFKFDGSKEDYEVGSFNNPSSTGTQKITTGFEPNFMMVKQTPRLTSLTDSSSDTGNNGFSHGWAANEETGTSQSTQSVSMDSGNINHHVFGAFDDRVLHTLWDADSSSSISGRVSANLDSWDSDGFTLNYTNVNPASGSNHVAIYFAAKSSNTPEVGMDLTPTSTGTQLISTESQTDNVFTAMTPTNPGINQDGASGGNQSENTHGWVFGGINSLDSQMSMGYASNSNSVNDHRSMSSATDVLKQPHTDEDGSLHGVDEADISNISSTDFDLNWTQIVTSSSGTAFDQTAYTYWSLGAVALQQASLSESFAVNEVFVKNLFQDLILDLDESLTVSETRDFVSNLFRLFNESLTVSEARSMFASVRQQEGFSVDVATGKQISKTFSEYFTVNDLYVDNAGFIKGVVNVDGAQVQGANVYIVKSGSGEFKGGDVTGSSGGYEIGRVVDDGSRYLVAVDFDDGVERYGKQKSIEVNFS